MGPLAPKNVEQNRSCTFFIVPLVGYTFSSFFCKQKERAEINPIFLISTKMAFRFPNVYDALYAESLAKKRGPITRVEYNRGVKEATFLGLQKTYPYLVETFTDLEDPNKGDIYAAQSQEKVAEILNKTSLKYFPQGKVNIRKTTEISFFYSDFANFFLVLFSFCILLSFPSPEVLSSLLFVYPFFSSISSLLLQ